MTTGVFFLLKPAQRKKRINRKAGPRVPFGKQEVSGYGRKVLPVEITVHGIGFSPGRQKNKGRIYVLIEKRR
jgi:hypothetical protein